MASNSPARKAAFTARQFPKTRHDQRDELRAFRSIAVLNGGDVLANDQTDERISVFVCGVQKGGTTSLFGYLSEHPDLQPPDRKELHFFDNEEIDWTHPSYEQLHDHFSGPPGTRLRFEVTPIYSFWPNSLSRIADYNPHAKLIVLFRDPYERALSHWAMEFGRNLEDLDFSEAIREGRTRLANLKRNEPPWRVFSYLERGLYAEQVSNMLRLFPRDQLLFLKSEDLRNDHGATLSQIGQFLGIREFAEVTPKSEHGRYATDGAVGPLAGDLAYVAEFVSADMARFTELTNLDIVEWPTQSPAVNKPST